MFQMDFEINIYDISVKQFHSYLQLILKEKFRNITRRRDRLLHYRETEYT